MGLVSLPLMQSLQISGAIPPLHSFLQHDMTLKCLLLFKKETKVFYISGLCFSGVDSMCYVNRFT